MTAYILSSTSWQRILDLDLSRTAVISFDDASRIAARGPYIATTTHMPALQMHDAVYGNSFYVGTAPRSAMDIRREWMRQMGLDEGEIAEFCDDSKYPANMQDELEELAAMSRITAREQEQRRS